MKTVLTTHDLQVQGRPAGGIATFTSQLALLLRSAGYDVSILHADFETRPLDVVWQANYRAKGIDVSPLIAPFMNPARYPNVPAVNLSEAVTGVLQMADVAYFHDWGNPAFDTLRRRRFDPIGTKSPVCVTVLHGPSMWRREALRRFIDIPDDLNRDYLEMYAAQHSDLVVSPSRYMVEWVTAHGWHVPSPTPALGLPFIPAFQQESAPGTAFNQLVYYGRLEKGLGLFTRALQRLESQTPNALKALEKIVLLGPLDSDTSLLASQQMTLADVQRIVSQMGLTVETILDKDSLGAQRWLAANAGSSLVVISSIGDNFPYTVIEASLIPGLNALYARTGGIPEILGEQASRQLFDPHPQALAAALAQWLQRGPLPDAELAHYDFEAANKRWLALQAEACSLAKQRTGSGGSQTAPVVNAPVDVCVAYGDDGQYLPQLLKSLARQTIQNFRVIVVAGGAASQPVFQEMVQTYPAWTFIPQEQAEGDAGRNRAAKEGDAPYIVFIDASDVAALTLVERFAAALTYCEDDGLVCRTYSFEGDDFPYDPDTGQITAGLLALHAPLGVSLTAAAADPSILGGTSMIIRRSVFEALGGFTEAQGAATQDREFHIRATMSGYKIDVLPETLCFHRNPEPGRQSAGSRVADQMRLLQPYETQLEQLGLGGMALAFQGLYQEAEALKKLLQEAAPRSATQTIQMDMQSTAFDSTLDARLWQVEHRLETRLAVVEDRQTLRGFLKYVLPASWVVALKRIVDRGRS